MWRENLQKNPKPRLIELFLYPAPLSCERGFFNLFVFFVIIFIRIVFNVLIVITQYLGWKLNFWSLLPFPIFNGRSKFVWWLFLYLLPWDFLPFIGPWKRPGLTLFHIDNSQQNNILWDPLGVYQYPTFFIQTQYFNICNIRQTISDNIGRTISHISIRSAMLSS